MESNLVAWLRARLPAHAALKLGPGDDAAVLDWTRRGDVVATVDLLTEGVDFVLAEKQTSGSEPVEQRARTTAPRVATPREVGRKALAVNLSDLAAMAARPVAALVALALPRRGGLELAQELYEGLLPLAERYGVAIAGGDTNSWDGPLVVSITALGELTRRGPLLRSGAQPGDAIVVTGDFGGSILAKHLDFEPRVAEALRLHQDYELHAGTDVSDGLALDLSRLSHESGCGAVIKAERVPISGAARQLAGCVGQTFLSVKADQSPARRAVVPADAALRHALGDGEDFELILAVPPEEARRMLAEQPLGTPLSTIGRFVPERGLWLAAEDGTQTPLAPLGYEHAFE